MLLKFYLWRPIVRWLIFGLIGGVLPSLLGSMFGPSQAFVVLSSYSAFSRQYEVGTIYSFDYETSLLLNEPQPLPVSSPKDVGFRINLEVDIVPVWQNPSNSNEQIIELKVSTPKLSVKAGQGPTPTGFVNKPSKADKLGSFPFYLHREGGIITKVFYDSKDHLSFVNIKKGIASLLQYQVKDEIGIIEIDSSGQCDVSYTLVEKNLVQKTKTNCHTVRPTHTFNHTNKVLDVVILNEGKSTIELDSSDGTVKRVSSVETHTLYPEIRKTTSGAQVIGRQILELKESSPSKSTKFSSDTLTIAIKDISENIRTSLVSENLATNPESKECILCKTLKDLVGSFRKILSSSNLGTQSSSIAFLRLLRKFRDSDMADIKGILTDKKNNNILPQILDIVAATQTIPAHDAAMTILKFQDPNISLPERYLLALSLSTHPLEYIIEDLMKILNKKINNVKLKETLVLTIASMTNTFSSFYKNRNSKLPSTVLDTLLKKLEKCKADNCQLMYIRALKNLKNKASMPNLLKFAKSSQRKQAIYAMRAIQTMPYNYIDPKTIKEFEKILLELDGLHDSTVRVMAAEILLRTPPSKEFLLDIFNMMKNPKNRELNTIMLAYIMDIAEKDVKIAQSVREVLRIHNMNNYNILAQGGLSSAFSRSLTSGSTINGSFTNMLEIHGGFLKRSNVDVFVDVGNHRIRILSFGIFAGGLSMFNSDDSKASVEEEEEEANAGIEIALQDSQLRPYVFFTGQGELMGHVWSGTASEKTTALQGMVLLQDHLEVVPMQNGLNIEFLLTGVVSYDFSGQIQISLWNRNANSLVEVGAATVVQGQARVDNSFIQTMVEFNVGSQSQLNFVSDLDFSDEITMCLKMEQPQFSVIDNIRKLERIPGSNYILRKYKRKKSVVPGKTYVMNRKNTELCNKIHKK